MASDSSALSGADILLTESASADAPQGESTETPEVGGMRPSMEQLALGDVFLDDPADPSLGAHLTVESIGGDTVVSIDSDAMRGGSIQIVTLQGVTDVTLQQLLNTNDCMG